MDKQKKTILFASSGTGGPTAPLIAIYEALKSKGSFEFQWIGTKNGPERAMLSSYPDISFVEFPAAKLRRYFAWRTFIEPFVFVYAVIKSLALLIINRPSIIVTTGAFVAVPVVIAGWVLRIPSLIHQQDIRPTLSNKLMHPFARKVTVTFEAQKKNFPHAVVTGNPVRQEILSATANDAFDLEQNIPTLFVMGGGTGSKQINDLVHNTLSEVTQFCQVIHVMGKGKFEALSDNRYHAFEFMKNDEIPAAYAMADVVVTRAGMSSLTELSVLGKPTIIIPMPHSHQEENAEYYKSKHAAAVLNFDREVGECEQQEFVEIVKELITNKEKQQHFSENIKGIMSTDAAGRVAEQILTTLR